MTGRFPFGDREAISDLEKVYWNLITATERCAEQNLIPDIVNKARERGYLKKCEFIKIATWKSPRPRKWYESNSENDVRRLSKLALGKLGREEALRALDELQGVALPTATAILHWFRDDTPIIDVRVLSALDREDLKNQKSDYGVYREIADRVIAEARRIGVNLRTLDRALWAWDKANKGRRSGSCR